MPKNSRTYKRDENGHITTVIEDTFDSWEEVEQYAQELMIKGHPIVGGDTFCVFCKKPVGKKTYKPGENPKTSEEHYIVCH